MPSDEAEDRAILELANAIIIRACQDYAGTNEPYIKADVKRFLNSEWFMLLSRGCLSPEAIINQLDGDGISVCREYNYRKDFYYRMEGHSYNGHGKT